ncbi:MAG: magnesium transporter [Rubrobacter sp.]|nr:magnesium transporter [Rubrobacter sp.]
MLYLSEVLNLPVIDAQSRTLGRVADLAARLGAYTYPYVSLIRVNTGRRSHRYVSWRDVLAFEATQIILSRGVADLSPTQLEDADVLLSKNVLDKQIVDLEDRKLVRVQDVQLARTGHALQVLGVDISASALVRRLGFKHLANALARRFPPPAVEWQDVELTDWRDSNLRLRFRKAALNRLHPADLAEIAASLSSEERKIMLETLPDEVAADTVEEMSPKLQVSVVDSLDGKEAAGLVEEMDPDDASSLLEDLPQERAQEILSLLPRSEAQELEELLSQPEDSAGGLMTPEYLSVRPRALAREVIEGFRNPIPEGEHTFYIYVTDEAGHLCGVFSLRDLILADPEIPVEEFMTHGLVYVSLDAKEKEVVCKIMKYNLKAIPVVDDENGLKGIVTIDDVIDLVGPKDWRQEGTLFS